MTKPSATKHKFLRRMLRRVEARGDLISWVRAQALGLTKPASSKPMFLSGSTLRRAAGTRRRAAAGHRAADEPRPRWCDENCAACLLLA